jgi:hypothetical protein
MIYPFVHSVFMPVPRASRRFMGIPVWSSLKRKVLFY